MPLSIRSKPVEEMARALARRRGVSITRVIETALEAEMKKDRETPSEIARQILARRGIVIEPGRPPVPQSAYHDLDHDLTGADEA